MGAEKYGAFQRRFSTVGNSVILRRNEIFRRGGISAGRDGSTPRSLNATHRSSFVSIGRSAWFFFFQLVYFNIHQRNTT